MTRRATLLTKADCALCEQAKEVLRRLEAEGLLEFELVDLHTPEGQQLAAVSGMAFPPGLLLDADRSATAGFRSASSAVSWLVGSPEARTRFTRGTRVCSIAESRGTRGRRRSRGPGPDATMEALYWNTVRYSYGV